MSDGPDPTGAALLQPIPHSGLLPFASGEAGCQPLLVNPVVILLKASSWRTWELCREPQAGGSSLCRSGGFLEGN